MTRPAEPHPQPADQALDQMLGVEAALVPTSGFLAAVMDRVREEAAAPAPIAFPWKRILPGVVGAAGILIWASLHGLPLLVAAVRESLRAPNAGVAQIHLSSSASALGLAAGVALLSWMIVARILRRA
jgi:hypothetical protein